MRPAGNPNTSFNSNKTNNKSRAYITPVPVPRKRAQPTSRQPSCHHDQPSQVNITSQHDAYDNTVEKTRSDHQLSQTSQTQFGQPTQEEYMAMDRRQRIEYQNKLVSASIDNVISTHDTAATTSERLAIQNEQLTRIDNDVSSINDTLTLTDRVLSGMESFGMALYNSFWGASTPQSTTYASTNPEASQRRQSDRRNQNNNVMRSPQPRHPPPPHGMQYAYRYCDDPYCDNPVCTNIEHYTECPDLVPIPADRLQKQSQPNSTSSCAAPPSRDQDSFDYYDDQLDKLATHVSQLRVETDHIGRQVQTQNKHAKHVNQGVTRAQQRVQAQDRRAGRYLGRP